MKLRFYRFLFRLFSFLSDNTNGFRLFSKYKIVLGTIILGTTITACNSKREVTCYDISPVTEDEEIQVSCYDTIAPPEKEIDMNNVTCYKIAVPRDTTTKRKIETNDKTE